MVNTTPSPLLSSPPPSRNKRKATITNSSPQLKNTNSSNSKRSTTPMSPSNKIKRPSSNSLQRTIILTQSRLSLRCRESKLNPRSINSQLSMSIPMPAKKRNQRTAPPTLRYTTLPIKPSQSSSPKSASLTRSLSSQVSANRSLLRLLMHQLICLR